MTTSLRRLDELCVITMGQAPPGDSYNTTGRGLPLIAGASDFYRGRPRAQKFTTAPSKVCGPGDIVVGIRASIGAQVLSDGEYCLGRGVAGLRHGRDLDQRFLWHWLSASSPVLAAKGRGATFLQVNREDIGAMQIPLLPLQEQRRIAAILDEAEALRARRRRSLFWLQELEQAMFVDLTATYPCQLVLASELMPVMRNGVSPSTGGKHAAEVLTLSAVTQGGFDPTAVKSAYFAIVPPADKRVSAFDFLMCRGNGNKALVGTGVCSGQHLPDLVFPDTVIAGRVDLAKVTMCFLEVAWRQQAVRRQIDTLARTTNGTYKVNQQALASVKVPVPQMHRQLEFDARLERLRAHRVVVEDAAAADNELMNSLLDGAFPGGS